MRVILDRFEFDTDRRLLVDGSTPVRLSPKAFRLLEILVQSHPQARSKQDLTDAIWPDTFVEESNLAGLVTELRGALGDDARQPRIIRTVHTFGYALHVRPVRAAGLQCPAMLLVRGETVPLAEGENLVGRDATNAVVIHDPTISRRHARLILEKETAWVEDLGSKNGTFVDGRRIDTVVPLHDRQTITFGEIHTVFSSAGATAATISISPIHGQARGCGDAANPLGD